MFRESVPSGSKGKVTRMDLVGPLNVVVKIIASLFMKKAAQ